MSKVFLWCDCSYTKMGLLSLFPDIFHKDFEVVLYDRTNRNTLTDICCFIFVISGYNFFEAADFIRNNKVGTRGIMIIMLSNDNIYYLFDRVCNVSLKKISIYNSIFDLSKLFRVVLNDNKKDSSKIGSEITKKELQVMELFMSGKTVSEVASVLHRSIKTISYHKQNFLRKLGIRNNLVELKNLFQVK